MPVLQLSPLADTIVFNKVRSKFGGKVRFVVSGGAPLGAAAEEFLHISLCCPVLQVGVVSLAVLLYTVHERYIGQPSFAIYIACLLYYLRMVLRDMLAGVSVWPVPAESSDKASFLVSGGVPSSSLHRNSYTGPCTRPIVQVAYTLVCGLCCLVLAGWEREPASLPDPATMMAALTICKTTLTGDSNLEEGNISAMVCLKTCVSIAVACTPVLTM